MVGGSQRGGGDGGGTEGELGPMDRAACLNMNTRPFQHRSTSRFHIIARRQAWGHTHVAPGNPIEMTNATEVSCLAPRSTAAATPPTDAAPPSTDAASCLAPRSTAAAISVAPRMPASPPPVASRVPSDVCQKFLLRSSTHFVKFHSGQLKRQVVSRAKRAGLRARRCL